MCDMAGVLLRVKLLSLNAYSFTTRQCYLQAGHWQSNESMHSQYLSIAKLIGNLLKLIYKILDCSRGLPKSARCCKHEVSYQCDIDESNTFTCLNIDHGENVAKT